MTILFQLPKDISVSVLSQWCEIADLICLDTACCSAEERPDLFKIFSSTGFALISTVKLSQLAFCVVKSMTLKSMSIDQKDFLADLFNDNFLEKIKLSKVEMFALISGSTENMQFIEFGHILANKCGAMISANIECVRNGDWFISSLQPAVLHNLKRVYSNMVNFGSTGYHHLAQHCHFLQYLCIAGNEQITQEEDIIALIADNPNLTCISFDNPETTTITNQTVQCIIDHGPRILSLNLTVDAPIPLSTINALLSKQPMMEHIHIRFKDSNIQYTSGNISNKTLKTVTIFKPQQAFSEYELAKFFALTSGCELVDLFDIPTINSVVLSALFVHNSASLTMLSIMLCHLVTSSDVVKLIEKCPLLNLLTIYHCPLVEKYVIEVSLEKLNRKLGQLTIK